MIRHGFCLLALAAALVLPSAARAVDANAEAKPLFSRTKGPADLPAKAIGFYTKGCLAGARELPIDGPYHQVMRLSRNRNWGHPELIDFMEKLAEAANREAGWPGLLVGDLAQPRGGPMPRGHASHQVGLDADIWLMPAPPRRLSREEREQISAASVIGASKEVPCGTWKVDPTIWSEGHLKVIRAAASDPRVARIFVHPAIKKALCQGAGNDRAWLRRVRPWYGHHYHFHVRLACPAGETGCKDQPAPPAGDGCGAALSYWFSAKAYNIPSCKPGMKIRPRAPMLLSHLPAECKKVIEAK